MLISATDRRQLNVSRIKFVLVPELCPVVLSHVFKHFSAPEKYHNFNKNTIKVGYSCMYNMGDITRKHNPCAGKLSQNSERERTRLFTDDKTD